MIGYHDVEDLISAENIAIEADIEYRHDAMMEEVTNTESSKINKYFAYQNRYVMFCPPNSDIVNKPVSFYGKFGTKIEKLMDNQSAYKNITNLSSILMEMVRLYEKHIDDNTIIAPYRFLLRLKDEVIKPNYIGKADLVMEDNTLFNQAVEASDIPSAKKFFINQFIDHFLGLNFGVVIREDLKLEKNLLKFNKMIISKGLREFAGLGIRVLKSDAVQQYDFKTE